MIAAELLKLRRNRGAMWTALLCAVGLPLLLLGLDWLSGRTEWGGTVWADAAFKAALWPGLAAACAIGVGAGTGDASAGVLRTLVATGCPRPLLLAARVPAALAAVLVSVALSWLVILAIGVSLHHGTPALTLGHAVDQLPALVIVNVLLTLAGLGLGAAGLTGTQATTLLLAVILGGLPAASVPMVPDWLVALLPPVAARSLVGGTQLLETSLPDALAVAGLLAWLVVPAAVGAWRFARTEL